MTGGPALSAAGRARAGDAHRTEEWAEAGRTWERRGSEGVGRSAGSAWEWAEQKAGLRGGVGHGVWPRMEVAWAAAREQAREKRGKEKEASWACGPQEREKRRDGPAGFPWAGLWSF